MRPERESRTSDEEVILSLIALARAIERLNLILENEQCSICGYSFVTLDEKYEAVFSGVNPDTYAHKNCYESHEGESK